ncbi:MAG: RagB/SusD family nutrient uptake outer membrane protein [Bacteroidota bacterium]|nr:RagB/SusD family nutrient uptake outer membrane protein [Bacteroidota bacterium]
MKSLQKILAILLPLTTVFIIYESCKKSDLDLLPHGPTEAAYFTQESDFTKAVLGVYAKMDDWYWYNGGQSFGATSSGLNMLLLPGDDITCGDQNAFEIFGSIDPSNYLINYFYQIAYQLIARANVVLEKVATVEDGVYVTPNLKDYHKGEALFLRGFAYYYLWNFYGTSPLDTVRVTNSSQFTPPGTTGTQLLDQAITDFTDAAALLPVSWDDANRGRVTRNSAYGMLGKSLVFRASFTNTTTDYTAALAAFNNISGVQLTTLFDDNFAFDTENNSESLFEFQASQAFGLDNVWLPNDFDNPVGNISVYWGFYGGPAAVNYGQARFVGTAKLAGAFDANDPRKAFTLDGDGNILKYITRDKLDQVATGSVNNYRLLRYADVLLLQAEATLQSGGSTSEAIGYINEVRKRAREMVPAGTAPADYSTSETDKATIMNWIMNERLIELAGEGQRWFDLRRWDKEGIISLDNAYFSSIVSDKMSFQAKHIFFPIPNSEMDVNPNVKQNDGY